ncbi:MAG: LPS assembly protein LptD, partial [Chitinivibrionales bacterium]|nr:LPS assembly protein LptD [Chitinivibrionales bacterium]
NSSFRPYDNRGSLSVPNLMRYNVSIRPRNLSASGTFWGGDLLVHKGLHPEDDPMYANAGDQKWNVSISPSYSFSQSRTEVDGEFTTERSYNLNMSARLNFSQRWSASWNGYYNFVTGKLEGHSVNFHCDLECWDLRFDWRPSGYNSGFYFVVGIKEQPDIKWEYE